MFYYYLERFSYHGISTLLVLYFTASVTRGGIGLSPKEATSLYGLYVGVLHLTPLIGGWLSDRYLGQQKIYHSRRNFYISWKFSFIYKFKYLSIILQPSFNYYRKWIL